MNLTTPINNRPHIAVIGSGIAGLASAYRLSSFADVTVFEAADRFGGHAHTVYVGEQPVDMGFIVFNFANYPHLTRMFKDLEVPIEKSNMSFGVTVNDGEIEYALENVGKLFAQKRNLARPEFYRMLRDVVKFGKFAENVNISDEVTIGQYIADLGLGEWFTNYYLLPISGAIWSTPPSEVHKFPAKSLIRFFQNHGLLKAGHQHQWWTVSGGSITYVERLTRYLKSAGVTMHTNAPVTQVTKTALGVEVSFNDSEALRFDGVVMACHSDDAMRLVKSTHPIAVNALKSIRYQDNRVVLHNDIHQMPHNRKCWSSWVYQSVGHGEEKAISATYWMNRLQNIVGQENYFVTLNPARNIADAQIFRECNFRHPIFDLEAMRAQRVLAQIQGKNCIWFAGAYLRHGFHEDGFASAVRVTDSIKARFKTADFA